MPTSFSVLELCTSHVTKDVGVALDERFRHGAIDMDSWTYHIVGSPWSEYGWWIWTEVEDDVGIPPCLRHCLRFAADLGHRWVQFDCDVEPIAELPTWEW